MCISPSFVFAMDLKTSQLPCRFCDSHRRAVRHIVSSGSLTVRARFTTQTSDATYSYLATKLLRSYAGWFGGYGWDLASFVLEHFLEKSEISSLPHRCCDFCLLTCFTSAFKYCCRTRGEKLERTNIAYGCLARVVRDGGFVIALIARLSAIPGHCRSLRLLVTHQLTGCSHHRGVQYMRDGHRRVFLCGFAFPPQAIHYGLFRSRSRAIRQR